MSVIAGGSDQHKVKMSSRNNYHGRAGQTGFLGTFGHKQAEWESAAFARQHQPHPGTGEFGITYFRPCNSEGKVLDPKEGKDYKITYNGRTYGLDQDGKISFCDTSAFLPAIEDQLEKEHYLSKLSTFILAGNELFEQIFPNVLEYCAPHKSAYEVRGTMIPHCLADEDCSPSLLRLFDPTSNDFLKGLAKLRAILSTYSTVMLGELPSWSMGFGGAGEKNDVQVNKAASGQSGTAEAKPMAQDGQQGSGSGSG